jgi:hypothetical protein
MPQPNIEQSTTLDASKQWYATAFEDDRCAMHWLLVEAEGCRVEASMIDELFLQTKKMLVVAKRCIVEQKNNLHLSESDESSRPDRSCLAIFNNASNGVDCDI